jgi:chromosomal replication initiation ATPase DnaA
VKDLKTIICEAVAETYGLEPKSIAGDGIHKTHAEARQVFCLLVRELCEASLPEIGRMVSRDHTTVMQGIRAAKRKVESSSLTARRLEHARKLIRERAGDLVLGGEPEVGT